MPLVRHILHISNHRKILWFNAVSNLKWLYHQIFYVMTKIVNTKKTHTVPCSFHSNCITYVACVALLPFLGIRTHIPGKSLSFFYLICQPRSIYSCFSLFVSCVFPYSFFLQMYKSLIVVNPVCFILLSVTGCIFFFYC